MNLKKAINHNVHAAKQIPLGDGEKRFYFLFLAVPAVFAVVNLILDSELS